MVGATANEPIFYFIGVIDILTVSVSNLEIISGNLHHS